VGILESGSRRTSSAVRSQDLVAAAKRTTDPNRATLMDLFRRRLVTVETTEDDGSLLTYQEHGVQWVHAYTDPEMLPGARWGQEVFSVTLTGAELLRRLPAEVGVRLDHGHQHSVDVVLPTARPVAPIVDEGQADDELADDEHGGGDGVQPRGRRS
jgi:hypothetical protein